MAVENLKGEKWKVIKGFPKYKISSYGRVLSLDFGRSGEEKLLNPAQFKRGYQQVCLANNGRKVKYLVHRLVAEAFLKNPDNLPQIKHKDGDLTNNKVENLEWSEMVCNSKPENTMSRSERKQRAKAIFKELDYEYTEEAVETAKVGDYEVVFVAYKNVNETCSKCFLNNSKKCLACRSFERKDGKDGYWRFFRKKSEFDVIEGRKRSNIFRKKNKEKGGYDE